VRHLVTADVDRRQRREVHAIAVAVAHSVIEPEGVVVPSAASEMYARSYKADRAVRGRSRDAGTTGSVDPVTPVNVQIVVVRLRGAVMSIDTGSLDRRVPVVIGVGESRLGP